MNAGEMFVGVVLFALTPKALFTANATKERFLKADAAEVYWSQEISPDSHVKLTQNDGKQQSTDHFCYIWVQSCQKTL